MVWEVGGGMIFLFTFCIAPAIVSSLRIVFFIAVSYTHALPPTICFFELREHQLISSALPKARHKITTLLVVRWGAAIAGRVLGERA